MKEGQICWDSLLHRVCVKCQLDPLLLAQRRAEHHGGRNMWKRKLLTSEKPRSRERNRQERTKARLPLPKPQMVEEKAIIAAVTK